MLGQLGHSIRLHTRFPGHGLMDDITTERSFDSHAAWVIHVIGSSFEISSMGVYRTRHWQPSGRLVQEFNVGTIA